LHGNGHATTDYGVGEGKRQYVHERIRLQDDDTLNELAHKRPRLN
jgi:hypothetical protein